VAHEIRQAKQNQWTIVAPLTVRPLWQEKSIDDNGKLEQAR